MAAGPATSAADDGYVRLHITPLDPQLLSVVLPSSARPDARNISYHSIQTFPEKRYGFVDLPQAAADRLRKKLNGAVLKGVKLRVEPARPKQEPDCETENNSDDDDTMATPRKSAGEESKSKGKGSARVKNTYKYSRAGREAHKKGRKAGGAGAEEIAGVELEAGRQVKRGWTDPGESGEPAAKKRKAKKDGKAAPKLQGRKAKKERKGKKKQVKSQFTDKPECLIKTILPPKAAAEAAAAAAAAGETGAAPAGKKSKKDRTVVVHEFENSIQFPSFLKSSSDVSDRGANLEYVSGKGWVDAEGNVVQALKSTRPATMTAKLDAASIAAEAKGTKRAREDTSDEDSDSASREEEEEEEVEDDSTSSSGSSSEEEEEEEEAKTLADSLQSPRPKSSGSAKSLTIKIPPAHVPPTTPAANKVHPLEALYKRPSGEGEAKEGETSGGAAQGFSFFGGGHDEDEEEDEEDKKEEGFGVQQPMTPFTKEEFEWRSTRSAAPTPDTAHPSRMSTFKWPAEDGEDDENGDEEDGDEEEDDNVGEDKGKESKDGQDGQEDPSSDFQTWFWDKRGDLNRSWKKRRKTASKEKRYRDNRARAERAI